MEKLIGEKKIIPKPKTFRKINSCQLCVYVEDEEFDRRMTHCTKHDFTLPRWLGSCICDDFKDVDDDDK